MEFWIGKFKTITYLFLYFYFYVKRLNTKLLTKDVINFFLNKILGLAQNPVYSFKE